MKLLVVGAGGREHALCWKLAQSPKLTKLYAAPGNAGMASVADCVDVGAEDVAGLVDFARDKGIDLVVVGPEAPLVKGLADQLNEAGIPVFGPSAKAAQLEGSKGFTKDLCTRANIPTAAYGRFTNLDDALAYVGREGAPIVVKADGLAAGKGVTVAMTTDEALDAVREAFDGRFGDAGTEVVIEDFLEGEEASFFALCDGTTALPLATAQDHKRVGDGDTGPNTGGMGAYSPAPVMTPELVDQVMATIIEPTLATMKADGMPYKGVLYAGLMITADGPELIEYNARFGDPECQVLMMRMESDLLELLYAAAKGELKGKRVAWRDDPALTVVMAAKGYPGTYDKGTAINGLDDAASNADVEIFHAGTALQDGQLVATGGRVLNVTAVAPSVAQAQALAYAAIDKIDWPDGFCRRDIGWRAIEREDA
ncbi:phosphoribosylamine--glycine ligase [Pyruvatibacter mobilis]|uniref:Phosphoribosylamine--glycine ligase n=1 Tax=Pyruvatibacter mobilis TaxID=1712261 RepID=A0A845QCE8_9HYPH|nr:phosphoribosylamine--glycine ligase [Pyruvatibacter mobilis]NBG96283.1 phosphoribosylamine--glycine ligase [Pyruvatibacter mobilis]QJD75778.1 phosphoribosylamine--glycine ligase [Pyruvatibacter mobilis]GGD18495.1 phosphoribosylamine--glycine ligase [Pyruvatibacter mobilis]